MEYPDVDVHRVARIAKALDSPLRLRILLLLCCRTHVVHELVSSLEKSQPLISQHLRVLKQARLVSASRHGREVEYSIANSQVEEILTNLMSLADDDFSAELGYEASHAPSGAGPGITAIIEPPQRSRPALDPGLTPVTPKPHQD
ncbi:ArsR/SmtB family transcription factor [Corynebacterium sp. LK2510]|uniref:ArsR/SmtB family transcription factor n=1 Tax=Corynebacterium sp. LK2510 TaxID=3110472 RepID=UPI0034CFA8DC